MEAPYRPSRPSISKKSSIKLPIVFYDFCVKEIKLISTRIFQFAFHQNFQMSLKMWLKWGAILVNFDSIPVDELENGYQIGILGIQID